MGKGAAMDPTSATTVQPGTRMGPYEMVALLGAGGRCP